MSLALYRRYRPETFAQVIGQEHVTGPLQQALRNNRVNHAYLFSGPRGCGKTTSARILARCLNCEQGPTPTPCGECQSCRDLATGGPGSIDVIEIDAASNGGVDDTRDLREKAFFAPVNSRYKIYIIDEAHMVTAAGFNALLKVVEEPPEHLKFIFATTEPEKVIGTIRSRTHHYPFRLVPPGTLRDYLVDVCSREQILVEDGVFPLVVRAGGGSVRDSMSVMDQLLAGADERGVTYGMATALLGYTDSALLDEMVDAFAVSDGAGAFAVVDRVIEGGHDPRRFVADLLERLRDLVILAAVPEAGEKGLIDAPADRIAVLEEQARRFGTAELSRAADLVNTGLNEMRGATSPRLQVELICARVLLPAAFADERSMQARLERLERQAAVQGIGGGGGGGGLGAGPGPGAGADGGLTEAQPVRLGAVLGGDASPGAVAAPVAAAAAVAPPQPVAQAPAQVQAPAPAAPAAPGRVPGAWPTVANSGGGAGGSVAAAQPQAAPAAPDVRPQPQPQQPTQPQQQAPAQPQAGGAGVAQVRQAWPQVMDAVKGRRRVTWMLMQQAQVVGFDGATVQLGFEHGHTRDGFVNGGHDDVLQQALTDALGVSWRVECLVGGAGAGAGGGGRGAMPTAGRPAGGGPAGQAFASAATPVATGTDRAPGQMPGPGTGIPAGATAAPAAGPVAGAVPTGEPVGPAGLPVSAAAAGAAVPAPPAPVSVAVPSASASSVQPSAAPAAGGRAAASVPSGSPFDDDAPFPTDDDIPPDEDDSGYPYPGSSGRPGGGGGGALPGQAFSGRDLILRELGATIIEEVDRTQR